VSRRLAAGIGTTASLARLLDELGGIRPLPGLEGLRPDRPSDLPRIAEVLAEEVERCQRELIQASVQFLSLHEVAAGMLSVAEPERATDEIAHYLQRAFAFEQVFLLLVQPGGPGVSGRWRHPRESVPPSSPLRLRADAPEPRGGIRRALTAGAAVTVADAADDPPYHGEEQDGAEEPDVAPAVTSYAVIPLVSSREGRAVLGALGIASSDPLRPVSRAQAVTLESIAGSVAAIAENAVLYQALRRSERFREHLLDCVGSGVLAVDLDGRVLAANRLAETMSGFDEENALGRPAAAILPPPPGCEDHLSRTLREKRGLLRVDGELARADGSRVPVSVSTSLLRDETDRVYGAIATFVDLTEIRGMEERIRHLDRLAALGRFTAAAAHEIRNPLGGIAAGVQYLAKRLEGDEAQRENVGFITREVARLDRILQDLFQATRPARPMIGPCPLADIVQRAIRSLEDGAMARGIRFDVLPEPGLKDALADADQIHQVLLNLFKNACEASPDGGVVRVRLLCPRPRGSAQSVVEVRVGDEGPGIRPEDASRIFEPFFTTKSSGTGLGLYLSHGIVERHGGSLRVESEPGKGAEFVLELPSAPSPATGGSHDRQHPRR
jgi:PAS domain S-box-containing protein